MRRRPNTPQQLVLCCHTITPSAHQPTRRGLTGHSTSTAITHWHWSLGRVWQVANHRSAVRTYTPPGVVRTSHCLAARLD